MDLSQIKQYLYAHAATQLALKAEYRNVQHGRLIECGLKALGRNDDRLARECLTTLWFVSGVMPQKRTTKEDKDEIDREYKVKG